MARPIDFRFAPVPDEMLWDGTPSQVLHLWAAVYRIGDLRGGKGALSNGIAQTVLADQLGWSEKTVSRWAKIGAELGWLEVRRRGLGLPNEYRAMRPDETEVSDPERPVLALGRTEVSDPSSLREKSVREKRSPTASGVEDAWLREWWEQQNPRPTQSFVAIRSVARSALRSGWDLAMLRKAMTEAPVISAAALDLWRSRQNGWKPVSAEAKRHFAPDGDLARGASNREGESGAW